MLKEATIYFCLFDESHFSKIFNMRELNLQKLIDCVDIGKKSEAAKPLLFQQILLLN